jgi:flavin reductase (DIM6/NTAB) family NADH-FMN oxidoreductase RutF
VSAAAVEPGRIDGFALRSCLARFATGVAVATVEGPEGRHGLTVNSFTAVSLEPPLVLVAILKTARAHDRFPGRPFTVNVLGAEQETLARHFAGRPLVDQVPWDGSAGSPRLAGCLAVLDCEPWATYDGGDHTLVVGRVTAFSYREGDGLGYFCGRFVRLDAPLLGIEFLF